MNCLIRLRSQSVPQFIYRTRSRLPPFCGFHGSRPDSPAKSYVYSPGGTYFAFAIPGRWDEFATSCVTWLKVLLPSPFQA